MLGIRKTFQVGRPAFGLPGRPWHTQVLTFPGLWLWERMLRPVWFPCLLDLAVKSSASRAVSWPCLGNGRQGLSHGSTKMKEGSVGV